jgi:hypothetical protein
MWESTRTATSQDYLRAFTESRFFAHLDAAANGAELDAQPQTARCWTRWLAGWNPMSNSTSSRYPVTVTHLPLVRCAVCRRTMAHRSGQAAVVLTKHYQKAHPEVIGSD